MRERSSQGAIDDDEIFADSDDDYRAECGCVPSATSHRGVSLATPPSFVAIAHFAFQR